MHHLLYIALLGILGVLCRYGVDQYFGDWNENFPLTTLVVNILGSFIAGTIYALGVHKDLSPTLQTCLLVGFCGGFTTFSAYALQTLTMLERGKMLPALAYFVVSPSLGLLAALIPVLVAKKLFV